MGVIYEHMDVMFVMRAVAVGLGMSGFRNVTCARVQRQRMPLIQTYSHKTTDVVAPKPSHYDTEWSSPYLCTTFTPAQQPGGRRCFLCLLRDADDDTHSLATPSNIVHVIERHCMPHHPPRNVMQCQNNTKHTLKGLECL